MATPVTRRAPAIQAGPDGARSRHWNEQMMDLLRSGASAREERERARANEDEALARRQSAGILALVRGHNRSRVKHHVLRPSRNPAPGQSEVPG